MGGGGGKGKQTTTQTVETGLPDYVKPYYDRLLNRAEGESNRPYQTYNAQRLAGVPQDEINAEGMTRNLAGSGLGGINSAMSMFNQAGAGAGAMANNPYSGSQFTNQNVNSSNVGVNGINAQNVTAGQWGQAQADQYMNPYINSVLDQQRQRALVDHERSQIQRNTLATTSGNMNSARHGVIDALGNEEFTRQLSDINATGLNQAWNQAQTMFGSDRDAALQAGIANQNANLTGDRATMEAQLQAGISNQGSSLEAQRLNQAANLQAQQGTEQSRQFGADFGLGALGQQISAGRGMLDATNSGENINLGRIDALMKSGDKQSAYDQTKLDMGYNDFVNQRDWEKNSLNWMNGQLSGVPVSPNVNTSNTQYVSPLSRLLGLGLGALGAYRGTTGGA